MNERDNQDGRAGRIPGPLKWGALASLALLVLFLVLYMAGNLPESGFTDKTQFLLLRVLRYLSLFLSFFSVCALAFSVRLMVHKPRFRHALGIAFYFITGILGALLVILNSLIVVAAGGNG